MQCDLHMPIKDGYETCKDIRAWEHTNNYGRTPIIALSANVMSEVEVQVAEAGFDKFVSKPVNFKELSVAMKELIGEELPISQDQTPRPTLKEES